MWEMVSIFLQAAGVLLLLWLLVGWLVLGKDRGGTAVYVCRTGCVDQAEGFLRGCLWLPGAGARKMDILLVDDGVTPAERQALHRLVGSRPEAAVCPAGQINIHICGEAQSLGGTGAAAGNCGDGGISES